MRDWKTWLRFIQPASIALPLVLIGCSSQSEMQVSTVLEITQSSDAIGDFSTSFQVEPHAGYVVTVRQHEVDVQLAVMDPDGNEYTSNLVSRVTGLERVAFAPNGSGVAQIELDALQLFPHSAISVTVQAIGLDVTQGQQVFAAQKAIANVTGDNNRNRALWQAAIAKLSDASATLRKRGFVEDAVWADYLRAFYTYENVWDWKQAAILADEVAQDALAQSLLDLHADATVLRGMALIEKVDGESVEVTRKRRHEAQAVFDQSLDWYFNSEMSGSVAWVRNNKGVGYLYSGDWQEAYSNLSQAADIALRINADDYFALISSNMGVLLDETGDLEGGRSFFLAHIPSIRTSNLPRPMVANSLYQLAGIELKLGLWTQAIQSLVAALEYKTELGPAEQVRISARLANAYQQTNNLLRASVHLADAEQFRGHHGEAGSDQYVQFLRARQYALTGDYSEASSILTSLIPVAASPRDSAAYQLELARVYESDGRYDLAAATASKVTGRSDVSPMWRCAAQIHATLVNLRHQLSSALDSTRPTCDQDLPANAVYLQTQFDLANALLLSRHGEHEAARAAAETTLRRLVDHRFSQSAFEYQIGLERFLSSAMDDWLRIVAASTTASPTSTLAFLRSIRGNRPTRSSLPDLPDNQLLEVKIDGSDTREQFLRTNSAKLLEYDTSRSASARLAAGSVPSRRNPLPDNVAVIEYWLADDRGSLWLEFNGQAERFTIEGERVIGKHIDHWVEALMIPGSDHRQAGERVFSQVLAPAIDRLQNASEIRIVPHGSMHRLPFAALPIESGYLGEQVVITYLGLGTAQRSNTARPLSTATVFGVPRGNGVLEDLPATSDEIAYIGQFFGNVRQFTNGDATVHKFINEIKADVDIVHVASHGLIDQELDMLSGIVFSSGSGEPELLTISDLNALRIGARLVVLSGCETGLGRRAEASGQYGFPGAFLQGGAQSVISANWDVSDYASSELMAHFYASLAEGVEPEAALAKAQMKLAVGEIAPLRHPYYWAAWRFISG